MFDLEERISAFDTLGRFLGQQEKSQSDERLDKLNRFFWEDYQKAIQQAGVYNNWFTPDNVRFALDQWSEALHHEALLSWTQRYPSDFFEARGEKTIALIMAGNIPLVGFHDLLSVLITGHQALIKPSSDDDLLLPFICQVLVAIDRRFAPLLRFAEGKLTDFDAVIATGSTNSSRYFDYYFSRYPHLIRKNRTSVGVLTGEETPEDLKGLSEDVFRYFGLGCRNVSHLYLPQGFDLDRLFKAFYDHRQVIENKKYGNNYDYNRAILMMEKQPFLENGFLILREENQLHAPAAVLHYSYYQEVSGLDNHLQQQQDQLQCTVGNVSLADVPFGRTQRPALWDYADKVDTLKFLRTI